MAFAYQFVFEELQSLFSPDRLRTKPMFGGRSLYLDEKIVFILWRKDKPGLLRDNGIWVALSDISHIESMQQDFPAFRPIEMFAQRAFNDWLLLPEDALSFEEDALALCERLARRDGRIGKVPKPRKSRKTARKTL